LITSGEMKWGGKRGDEGAEGAEEGADQRGVPVGGAGAGVHIVVGGGGGESGRCDGLEV
jgi:hypothetical protein